MKRFAKCICLVLSLTLLLAAPAQAAGLHPQGAESPAPRASDYFMSSAVYLYKTSGNNFEAWFEVTCVRTMDEVGVSEIRIQRSTDDATWKTVATYYMDDNYSTMIAEDSCIHVNCVHYTGSSGYYYRAYYKLYAKDGSGSSTWSRYSSSIYIS